MKRLLTAATAALVVTAAFGQLTISGSLVQEKGPNPNSQLQRQENWQRQDMVIGDPSPSDRLVVELTRENTIGKNRLFRYLLNNYDQNTKAWATWNDVRHDLNNGKKVRIYAQSGGNYRVETVGVGKERTSFVWPMEGLRIETQVIVNVSRRSALGTVTEAFEEWLPIEVLSQHQTQGNHYDLPPDMDMGPVADLRRTNTVYDGLASEIAYYGPPAPLRCFECGKPLDEPKKAPIKTVAKKAPATKAKKKS